MTRLLPRRGRAGDDPRRRSKRALGEEAGMVKWPVITERYIKDVII